MTKTRFLGFDGRQEGEERQEMGSSGCEETIMLVLTTACYHDDCSLWSHSNVLSISAEALPVIWFNAPAKHPTENTAKAPK